MQRSRYDELYEKYYGILNSKRGTKYERLTAIIVFKPLYETRGQSGAVIHDLRVMGKSGVKHQIDVVIKLHGVKRRILIECKDFDISGDKVGLGILRDFWGAVDDIKPDEAIVITCNGFTRGSRKYAKAKGIKLAILREFQDEDWESRIKTIKVELQILGLTPPKPKFRLFTKEDMEKFIRDAKDAGFNLTESGVGVWKNQPVYLNTPEGRFQLNEFIERKYNDYPRDKPGPAKLMIPVDKCTLEVKNRGGVSLRELTVEFEVYHTERSFEINGAIPKLILEGFGEGDMILWDEDLKRYDIDPDTGEVISL